MATVFYFFECMQCVLCILTKLHSTHCRRPAKQKPHRQKKYTAGEAVIAVP
jgi:hypothetical protein